MRCVLLLLLLLVAGCEANLQGCQCLEAQSKAAESHTAGWCRVQLDVPPGANGCAVCC